MQALIGRVQLKSLNNQIKKRNLIANLYLNGLRDYYEKYDIFKKPDLNCKCGLNSNKNSCKKCIHAFYRLNLFLNTKKINQIELLQKLNQKKINCGVGSCAEIYREKF